MQKTSISKLASLHTHAGAMKYVFFDTCALLDILRLPAKYGASAQCLLSYKDILIKANAGGIVFVASYMTHIEQHCNKTSAEKTQSDDENNTLNRLKKYDKFASAAGLINPGVYIGIFDTVPLNDYLHDLYDSYVDKMIYLNEKMDYDRFAMYRVAAHIPPAESKGEYKDCYIWRTCMDLAQSIKPIDKLYFFTTNPKDFQPNPASRYPAQLHSDAPNVTFMFDINQLNATI